MTENLELNNRRNRFIATIIQSIQIEMDEFMMRVANKECYESMIHRWTVRLFEKGFSSDQAIEVIHRARRFVLMNKDTYSTGFQPDLTFETILAMLNEHPKYNELDKAAKLIVQKKVSEMFNNNARIEAIEEVLEAINVDINITIHVIGDKVMKLVRKWNPINFWKKFDN
ncbi:hypothetical protein [Aquimarina algiphila]|uniref:Uncharacterized protein n=1 Tax=Aquimarina algiphila TaxID=2047982 RepID=A0A554VCE3_9FLAO|nr:hypothetical protein [Aquimarina algiphila]TSE04377.1 hypothetical protein FOF46_26490 [Aquimarina algiphila]